MRAAALARAPCLSEPRRRVLGPAVDADFQVQVGAADGAGVADAAETLALRDRVASLHDRRRKVAVDGVHGAAVVEDHHQAVPLQPAAPSAPRTG